MDLNKLIANGVDLSIDKPYPTRMVQYRADKRVTSLMMRLPKNFAQSTYIPSLIRMI